jgi:hypothetical protein
MRQSLFDYASQLLYIARVVVIYLFWDLPVECVQRVRKYYDIKETRELKRLPGNTLSKKRLPENTLSKKRRSLTPPPSEKSRLFGRRHSAWADQSASLLLGSLPWELREMIWKCVVGGRYIHLGLCRSETYRGHLGYILCQSTDSSDWGRCKYVCYKKWHSYQPESTERMSLSYNVKPWKPPLIELLQTCHQM